MVNSEAYITGLGQSEIGQRLARHPLLLTLDAIREALSDSGLTLSQIDGVSTYPGRSTTNVGFSPIGAPDVVEALGIKATYFAGGSELTSQLGAIVAAVGAVKSGQARHVICFRTVYEAATAAQPQEPRAKDGRIDNFMQWLAPFNALSPVTWAAQYAMRHIHRYGLKREQLAQIALTDRKHAMLNPRALIRKPLTLEEYMAARPISTPLCLFDCDRFTDASTVLIVSAGDALSEVRSIPIRVAAMAHMSGRNSWDQDEWMAAYPTGRHLWTKTDYKPKDVGVAQLYDGFSFLACTWLEGLGFCKVGEVGQFLEGGHRIALDGQLPLNTFGGQIAGGRLHGFGFPHEATVQLRGAGGARQVPNDPKVAVCSAGGGPMATAILLARD